MDIEDTAHVTPRSSTPGAPSPEALQRLQAAVNNAPTQAGQQRPSTAARTDAASTEERTRFGINSLINRMTGHTAQDAPRPVRQQPPMQAARAPQPAAPRGQEEDDQIEIPAFLRRQAN